MSIAVRQARADDYPLFAALFVHLGVPEAPPDETRFATGMLPRVLVATEAGEGIGYAFYLVYGELAHVINVVVAESARGRGVGRALMEAVRTACRREGCRRWYLNVKRDNAPAIALYRRSGLLPDGDLWSLRLPWSAVAALPGEPAPSPAVDFGPERDATLAAWSGLPAARLSVLRARPGVVLRAFSDDHGPCALAAFDPAHPGINPLHLARPTLLRPLLEALRPSAGPRDYLHLAVERDPATVDAVLAAGGTLNFALVQMAGPLQSD